MYSHFEQDLVSELHRIANALERIAAASERGASINSTDTKAAVEAGKVVTSLAARKLGELSQIC